MYRRLNITLPDEIIARADEFARRERYTRSALIAAALDAFMRRDPRMVVVEHGASGAYAPAAPSAPASSAAARVYAPESVGLNPAIRPLVPAIIDECRRRGVIYAALAGSSTRPDPAITPRELEVLILFDAVHAQQINRRLVLQAALEILTNMAVHLIEIDSQSNESRAGELEPTAVVLYDAGAPDAGAPDA
ncbi:MAG TPA: hypothetical protein VF902_04720 [Coriobacteriia bacterium]